MNNIDPVQELTNITIPKFDIDFAKLPVFGYGKNTINGIAFTSADGNVSSGFNYSFGMIKSDNNISYYDMDFIRKHKILPPYNHNKPTEYFYMVSECFNQLANIGILLFRARLSVIPPMYTIPEHRDTPDDSDYCIKIHIPVQTNEFAKFVFGDNKFSLTEGKAYLANVAKLHSFENLGTENRYHIIADCIITNPSLPFYCNNVNRLIRFYNQWDNMLTSDNYTKKFRQDSIT